MQKTFLVSVFSNHPSVDVVVVQQEQPCMLLLLLLLVIP